MEAGQKECLLSLKLRRGVGELFNLTSSFVVQLPLFPRLASAVQQRRESRCIPSRPSLFFILRHQPPPPPSQLQTRPDPNIPAAYCPTVL